MRKHGWQLPYHPLQVVAIAVYLSLGFAFYVFFAPFVGKKMYQYAVMGLYTPLITCVFGLYIWCAATDPADPGVFKSKKYLKIPYSEKHSQPKNSKLGGESTSSIHGANASTVGAMSVDKEAPGTEGTVKDASDSVEKKNALSCLLLICSPCAYVCSCSSSSKESCDKQISEDGMFYCSLCEVEVFKYSKHCRVCDKCVDHFDHHCRWLNNCIGKRNYRQFFALMVVAILLLILQWLTGIFVLIYGFVERKQFSADISSKLGSSFSIVPFVIVVSVCTILAMIATLPVAQLFFFHILLVEKGISTYDYIIALREQEQEQQGVGGQQSPQMSTVSSLTGFSSASSFTTFQRGSWCTPPRLFVEDQFDVIPPETGSVSSLGKKSIREEPSKRKNPGAVKISPWTLARLNAEEVSKAAIGKGFSGVSSLAPLQLEPRSAFHMSQAMSSSAANVVTSSESSIESPDIHPFRVSSSRIEEARQLAGPSAGGGSVANLNGIPLSRSTSDGYEASGGEDSDQLPSRIVERSTNWTNLLFNPDQDERAFRHKSSSNVVYSRKF
ncbi:probable protein S-acyltransferase 22 [Arachis duranensis]|uniref:S-acyltransferase n=1 Tax=Arachis duranensis TaxID=130453 RepID=A0A6P4CTM1_ARADU|nr:probable protein S-acyltransferase 22 [Arachis duranensis]